MKICVIGDRHLDARSPRYQYALAQWDAAIEMAIDLGAEAFIGLGDLCEGDPNGAERLALAARYERMLSVGPVFEVLGNHEAYSALGWLKYLGVEVAWDAFGIHVLKDTCVLLLIPYPRRGRAPFDALGATTIDASMEAAAARIGKTITEAKTLAITAGVPLIVGAHVTIQGMRVGASDFEIHVGRETIVPTALFAPADLTITAHIHKAQDVTPRILGVGSLYHCSFAEAEERKSFLMIEPHGEEGICHTRVELMSRTHLDLTLSGAAFRDEIDSITAQLTLTSEIKLTLELEPGDPFNYEPLLERLREKAAYCVVKKTRRLVVRAPRAAAIVTNDVREQLRVWMDVTSQERPTDSVYQKLEEITS